MVQRKVANKLGIQGDHVKTEKLLANLKPCSSQYPLEGKNRGPDLKKKMKKSRSIKLSDIDSLRSPPTRRNISQPGKPPPPPPPLAAAIPQKQQLVIKATDGSPNYMKSTSCFDARKEQSQVSLRNNTQTGSSYSKHSSVSSNKPGRTLTRTSSLKLVRTLMKTPSFKPARASAKKPSRVVLCGGDMEAQRSTCSSTLKDSKFPAYLMLNPGGTESQGTSAMKVCPYTYCSLNGHRHAPSPPLKCFLSARRRLLKTQKSIKMEALSPRRTRPSSEGTKEIDLVKVIFDDKPTPAIKEADLGMDFFIEIYAKDKEDDTVEEHSDKKQVAESLSDGLAHSEVDFKEKLEQYSGISATEIDTTESFPVEEVEDYSPFSVDEEKKLGSFYNGCYFEELFASSEGEDTVSEATDMEWQEGKFSASELDSVKNDDECELYAGYEPVVRPDYLVSNFYEEILADEELQDVFAEESASSEAQSDDGDSEVDSMHQNSEIHQPSQSSESPSHNQLSSAADAFEELTSIVIPSALIEEPIGEPTATGVDNQEKNRVFEAENLILKIDPQQGDDETNSTSDVTDEASNNQQEQNFLQDNGNSTWLNDPISDDSENFKELDQVKMSEDYIGSHSETAENVATSDINLEQELLNVGAGDGIDEKVQVADAYPLVETEVSDFSLCLSEAEQVSARVNESHTAEDSNSSEEIDDESFTDETRKLLSDRHYKRSRVAEDQDLENDQGEAKKFKISSSTYGHSNSRTDKSTLAGKNAEEVDKLEEKDKTESYAEDVSITDGGISSPELPDTSNNKKGIMRCKRPIEDEDEMRKFNPREPNYLPLDPDPEAEKVDLRHQMIDERKNAEEWMVDYALQQAVTKLAPARKKKVALLVEAFETVIPVPKYEPRLRSTSVAFAHARPMQACS